MSIHNLYARGGMLNKILYLRIQSEKGESNGWGEQTWFKWKTVLIARFKRETVYLLLLPYNII